MEKGWLRAMVGIVNVALCAAAFAAGRTWNGGGGDVHWSTADNWGGTAPVAGDALLFGGTAGLANTNDLVAGSAFAGLTFLSGAGAFTLGGNAVTLDGDVVNNDADMQTLNLPITLGATRTFNAASGNLVFGGAIGGTGGIAVSGGRTVTLTAGNSYEGATTVIAGGLNISDAHALGGTDQGTTVEADGTLNVSGGITVAEPITLVNKNGGSLFFTGGANTCSGLITITNNQARIRNNAGAEQVICGGITSIAAVVILDSGANAGNVLRIKDNPIIAEGQKCFMHGTRSHVLAVSGNIFSRLEVAGGALLLDVPDAWPANLMLEVGVSYATGSTIDLQGCDQTVGQLTGAINSTNLGSRVITSTAGPATLTVNQSAATEFNSNFGGGVRLVKLGSGTLAVTGTNCFQTGQTVVGGGKLRIISEDTLGLAPAAYTPDHLVISNAATLVANNAMVFDDATRGVTLGAGGGTFEVAADVTVSNTITGTGSLTKTGAGTLALAGDNAYAGSTLVQAGTLRVDRKASLYGGGTLSADLFTVNSGATLGLGVGGEGAFTGADIADIAALGTAGAGFKPGSWLALYTEGSASVSDAFGNPSGGHGLNLQKLGDGTLELNGLNTYTGVTKIAQGVLSVATLADGGLPCGIGAASNNRNNLLFAGGTLRYTGPSVSTDRRMSPVAATNAYSIDVADPGTVLTLTAQDGSVWNGTDGVLEKRGSGTLTMGRTGTTYNLVLGAVHLLGGTLLSQSTTNNIQQNLHKRSDLGQGPALLLGDGVTLGYNTPLENAVDGAEMTVRYIGTNTRARLTSTLTLCGPTNLIGQARANTAIFDIADGADEVDLECANLFNVYPSSPASANTRLRKDGPGTLWLRNTGSSFTRETTVRGGCLLLSASVSASGTSVLGKSTDPLCLGDEGSVPGERAALVFAGPADSSYTYARPVAAPASAAWAEFGSVSNVNVTLSGAVTVSNTLHLLSSTAGTNALFVTGGIAGPGGVTVTGGGTVLYAAANAYEGPTTVAGGTLRLGAAERIADASPLRLTGGALDLDGHGETVGPLDVDGAAEIDFGAGGCTLICADSAAETWDGALVLRNLKLGGANHLYVGAAATLSEDQLARITSPNGQKARQLPSGEVILLPPGTVISVK